MLIAPPGAARPTKALFSSLLRFRDLLSCDYWFVLLLHISRTARHPHLLYFKRPYPLHYIFSTFPLLLPIEDGSHSVKEHFYHRRGFPLWGIVAVESSGWECTAVRGLRLLILDCDTNCVQLICSASLAARGQCTPVPKGCKDTES